jgi:cell division septation protein DedD
VIPKEELPQERYAFSGFEPTAASQSTQVASHVGLPGKGQQCFVHVGVFSEDINSQVASDKLNSMGVFNILIREVSYKVSGEEKIGTQVRLGPFASRTQAQEERNRLSGNLSFKIGDVACL